NRTGKEIHARALAAIPERIPDGHVEQPELRVDRCRFPDAAAVALAADPRRTGHVPSLIPLILGNRVEVPPHLACLRVDREHVAPGNVALAARASDVEDAVEILRRGREPV